MYHFLQGRYNRRNFASTANFVLYEVDRGNQHFRGYKHTEGNDFALVNLVISQWLYIVVSY